MATAFQDIEEPEEGERSEKTLADVHERALTAFDEDVLPQLEIRAHALLCRKFISIPGAMWDGDWGDQFNNSIRVEVDKLSKGVDKIVTDYRANRIVPDFRPSGGSSDQMTADTLDGIHRSDSNHFKAQQARDNAFEEAVAGGFGSYRLVNVLADPYDLDSDDQRINPGMLIADADQRVFFDANSKLYDKSDARRCFVLTGWTRDAFEAEFGEDKATSWPNPKVPLSNYDWYTPDIIVVAEYYEVEDIDAKALVLTHAVSGEEQRHWADDLSRGDLDEYRSQGWTSKTITRRRRRVRKYLMSGAEVLKDQGYIAGSCIPVVPVYGKRWYVENVERFRGHVSKRMDSQRAYNAMFSKVAETSALAPREKPIFLAQQMPPHLATLWENQEKDRHPYALVDPVIDQEGKYVAMGPIGKVEPASMAPADAAILQMAAADLTEDDDKADEVQSNVSADAMDIAAMRVDAKSGIYIDNMAQSVQREGEIYLEMAREVYFEPGRIVETMSEEGDDGEAQLHQPFTDKQGNHLTVNDFSSGKYKCVVDVTEATATRRDKTVRSMLATAQVAQTVGDQELGTVCILTAVMNQDGEGTSDVQTYARKRLVTMGVVEPTDDEKAQMEQAQQNAQPDPAQAVAGAQVQALNAKAGLDAAKTQESGAATVLKLAQAHALGGPEEAPAVPDGLKAAETGAKVEKDLAQAAHMRATADALPHEIAIEAHRAMTDRIKASLPANDTHHAPRILRGHEI
jgi:hypothetical protein